MASQCVVLHGGALGDLVLTIQLGLRVFGGREAGGVRVVSRTNPGDLAGCRPAIARQSADSCGATWLHTESDEPAPAALRRMVAGAQVLNALGDRQSIVHRLLAKLGPAGLWSFDTRPRPDLQRHITEQWRTDMEAQGLLVPKCVHQRPQQRSLGVPEEMRARGRDVLQRVGVAGEAVLIHPGSGGREKSWPLVNFVRVGRELAARGMPVCFVIGPVEIEWWAAAEIDALAREFPVLRLPGPDELAAALGVARAVVANDSGPAHLAALLGTRTVVMFGPTSATVWRPLGRDVRVVAGDVGADARTWGIDAEEVVAAVCGRACRL